MTITTTDNNLRLIFQFNFFLAFSPKANRAKFKATAIVSIKKKLFFHETQFQSQIRLETKRHNEKDRKRVNREKNNERFSWSFLETKQRINDSADRVCVTEKWV